jgi:hypothetical protein
MFKILSLFILLVSQTALAAGSESPAADPWAKRLNAEGILELEWDDLVPADFNPNKLFQDIAKKYNISVLADTDPRAKQIQAEIDKVWNHAPVVASLDNRRVRLPGLVVPLEGTSKKLSEFLLVPYFGACIHAPPPPSNQIVYVRTGSKKAVAYEMFEAVWVVGTLRTEYTHKELGDASYTLIADRVELYE